MKLEPKFYKAFVNSSSGNAGLICSSYYIDSAKEIIGIEYYQTIVSSNPHNFSIPGSRQATFQEELRVLNQATSIYKGRRADEKAHIEKNIRSAYDGIQGITLDEIIPKEQP